VDKENRYAEFLLSSIPYPGCEFFRDWKNNGYRAEGLVFDWNQVLETTSPGCVQITEIKIQIFQE